MLDTVLWLGLALAIAVAVAWLLLTQQPPVLEQQKTKPRDRQEHEKETEGDTVSKSATPKPKKPRQKMVVGLGAPLLIDEVPAGSLTPKKQLASPVELPILPPPSAASDSKGVASAAAAAAVKPVAAPVETEDDAQPTKTKSGGNNTGGKSSKEVLREEEARRPQQRKEPLAPSPAKAATPAAVSASGLEEPGWSVAGVKRTLKRDKADEGEHPAAGGGEGVVQTEGFGGEGSKLRKTGEALSRISPPPPSKSSSSSSGSRQRPRSRGSSWEGFGPQRVPEIPEMEASVPAENPLEAMIRDCLRLRRMDEVPDLLPRTHAHAHTLRRHRHVSLPLVHSRQASMKLQMLLSQASASAGASCSPELVQLMFETAADAKRPDLAKKWLGPLQESKLEGNERDVPLSCRLVKAYVDAGQVIND